MFLRRRKSAFWRDVSPTGAVKDFVQVFRDAGRARWGIMALSLVCTGSVFSLIVRDEQRAPPRLPTVTYITSWRADRSDKEIIASNLANQKLKEAEEAAQAQRDAEVKNIYKALGRVSGMDVDSIDKQAKADAAHDAAAAAAKHDALYKAGTASAPAPSH